MEDCYIIYREIFEDGNMERWFYSYNSNRDQANELAIQLNRYGNPDVWACVCKASEAKAFGIKNLPDWMN